MNAHQGLQRIKIAWAFMCILVAALALFLLFQSIGGATFVRMLIGVSVATLALAGLPFATLPIDARICIGIVAVWGGLAFAEGEGKWPEGFFISVILAGLIYGVCWVGKGFFGGKNS